MSKSKNKYSTTTKKKLESFCYCATVVSARNPEYLSQVAELEKIGKDYFTWYACIEHMPEPHVESDEEHFNHTHFLFYSSSPLQTSAIDKKFTSVFGDKSHMIEYVLSGSGYGRYLLHKRNLDKIQYDVSSLRTSSLDFYLKITRDSSCDSMDLWSDYKKLRCGIITPENFIDKYRADLASMPMYQRFSMFAKIFDTCSYTFTRSQSFDYSSDGCLSRLENNSVIPPTSSQETVIHLNNLINKGE